MKTKFLTMLAALLLVGSLVGCKTERTAEGEYRAETETSEAAAETETAYEETQTAVASERVDAEQTLENAGDAIEEGARDAARATGNALERAGQELKEHSQPGDQSDTTRTTT